MSAGDQALTKKQKQSPQLPWWVELLFVQVGLPDDWLAPVLRSGKDTRKFIRERKRSMSYALLAIAALLYFDPIIKEARIHNQCVEDSKALISEKISSQNKLDKDALSAWANNFCNGGDF